MANRYYLVALGTQKATRRADLAATIVPGPTRVAAFQRWHCRPNLADDADICQAETSDIEHTGLISRVYVTYLGDYLAGTLLPGPDAAVQTYLTTNRALWDRLVI